MGFFSSLFSRKERQDLPTLEALFAERQVPLELPGLDALLEDFEHMNAEDRTHWADAIADLHRRGRELPLPWVDAKFELLPQVVPSWQAEREGYYWRPFIDGLAERVLVGGKVMDEAWLTLWGATAKDVNERAHDHLREKSAGKPYQRTATGVYQSTFEDGLDASRILLPEFWEGLFPGQNTFLAIPSQDVMLVAPQVLLPKLVEAIGQTIGRTEQRVLAVIFQRVQGAILPANLQDPHPIAQPQRELRQSDLLEAYRAQDADLDPELGQPTPVTLLKTQQGRTVSTAIWAEGRPALVPEVDALAFVDAKGKPLGIYFRQTMPRISELKAEVVDIWGPRRVCYTGFPTAEQLERLEAFATAEQMAQIFAPQQGQQAKRPAPQPRQDPAASGVGVSSSPVPAHLRGQNLGVQDEQ